MSDGKVSLEFLGEQMVRMQADLRGVRAEQVKLESEQASTRADLVGLNTKIDVVDQKVDRVDQKIDNLAASVDLRFREVNQTMATNLDVVLKAIDAKRT